MLAAPLSAVAKSVSGKSSIPSSPAENSSSGKHSWREIRLFRITALQSTAAELSHASRYSCLICVKTSLPYHSPGVIDNRGESVGIIIFVSSPFSVYTVLVRMSPFMITGRHSSRINHCSILVRYGSPSVREFNPGAIPKESKSTSPDTTLYTCLNGIHTEAVVRITYSKSRGYARGCTSQLGSFVCQSQQNLLRVHLEARGPSPRPTKSKATFPKKPAGNFQPATGRTDT